jgi:hypothetical protein
MRKVDKVLAAVFIGLEAVVALLLIAMSVHGPAGLPIAAIVYFLVAASLTWWAGRRCRNVVLLALVGIALLATAPGVIVGMDRLEHIGSERRVAATRVANVRDEPILASTGRPIGVRVSYDITIPRAGYFSVFASVDSRDPNNQLNLGTARWTVDGDTAPRRFEAGRTHAVVVERYPSILFFGQKGRCLSPSIVPVPASAAAAPLRVMISETTYGTVFNGNPERLTRGAYDIAGLFRGVLAEGLGPCPMAQ